MKDLRKEGFYDSEEALRRFPKRHVPRGGNYNMKGVRKDIRSFSGKRSRKGIVLPV